MLQAWWNPSFRCFFQIFRLISTHHVGELKRLLREPGFGKGVSAFWGGARCSCDSQKSQAGAGRKEHPLSPSGAGGWEESVQTLFSCRGHREELGRPGVTCRGRRRAPGRAARPGGEGPGRQPRARLSAQPGRLGKQHGDPAPPRHPAHAPLSNQNGSSPGPWAGAPSSRVLFAGLVPRKSGKPRGAGTPLLPRPEDGEHGAWGCSSKGGGGFGGGGWGGRGETTPRPGPRGP